MALLINLGLFFALFMPLTFVVGYPLGFFVGPTQADEETYPLFIWLLTALPLLLPAVLWVPVVQLALRLLARHRSRRGVRLAAAGLAPLGFLAVHVAAWGLAFVSAPLLVLILLPGAAYGASMKLPSRARASE
jgi:hypothetical protein